MNLKSAVGPVLKHERRNAHVLGRNVQRYLGERLDVGKNDFVGPDCCKQCIRGLIVPPVKHSTSFDNHSVGVVTVYEVEVVPSANLQEVLREVGAVIVPIK
jgi:hypothetical protein